MVLRVFWNFSSSLIHVYNVYDVAWDVMHCTAELRQTVRQEMENNRNCNDKQRIRYLISDGLERLKQLDEMLDMQGHWES